MHSLYNTAASLQINAVGVSLKLQGVTIPNNSLVDVDDIYSAAPGVGLNVDPSNDGPKVQALLCITDLINCCKSPKAVHGDWYYPNGSVVQNNIVNRANLFRRNRGPYEFRNGRQFYGSVRLWRRNAPTERGHFCCELPNAANSNINQTLCVYICEFVASYLAIGA